MMSPDVPCVHFALRTLSETYFKDAVFDVHVRQQQLTKVSKTRKRQNWHDNKKRIITRYCFGSVNTFWYTSNHFVRLFYSLLLVCFWYVSCAEFLPPTVYVKKMMSIQNIDSYQQDGCRRLPLSNHLSSYCAISFWSLISNISARCSYNFLGWLASICA